MASLFHIREDSTPIYSAVIKDENGNVLPASTLDTITLTYYDEATGAIINSRTSQDILNLNNVTIDNVGQLLWSLEADDTQIITDSNNIEERIALFEWAWTASGVPRQSNQEVRFHVRNLVKVP